MTTQDFMNTIYDLIANNPVDKAYEMSHDEVVSMVDCVDHDRQAILFVDDNGVHHELQLVSTFAPKTVNNNIGV